MNIELPEIDQEVKKIKFIQTLFHTKLDVEYYKKLKKCRKNVKEKGK